MPIELPKTYVSDKSKINHHIHPNETTENKAQESQDHNATIHEHSASSSSDVDGGRRQQNMKPPQSPSNKKKRSYRMLREIANHNAEPRSPKSSSASLSTKRARRSQLVGILSDLKVRHTCNVDRDLTRLANNMDLGPKKDLNLPLLSRNSTRRGGIRTFG